MQDSTTKFGTISGTLFSLSVLPPSATIITTVICALIGATTSFLFTLLLKKVYTYFTKEKYKD